jgi:hypothetical protein
VLVVGDSQALSMGFGLQGWGDAQRTAWVWNRGAPGCPFSTEGTVRFLGEIEIPEACVEAVAAYDRIVVDFKPDVVIAVPGMWDLLPRRLDGWDDFKTLGDPGFDAYIAERLGDAHRRLSAGGATVVWATAPCIGKANELTDDQLGAQNAQRDTFNTTVLADMLAAHPDAVLFDLDEVLCPNDVAIEELPSGEVVRYDGLHFSTDGAEWFAETYGPTLLEYVEN